MLLFLEQSLNGLQFGLLLFLLAAGLTLVFGIMDLVNLAHGSLYMVGAYFASTFVPWTGSFVAGALLALGATLVVGIVVEMIALRPLYGRDHLDHVLGTFGLILFFNELVRIVWGPAGRSLRLPAFLETSFEILPGVQYPTYRIAIIITALAVALFLYILVMRTRLGMLIRAGASNREMAGALGVNIKLLYTLVFGCGATRRGALGGSPGTAAGSGACGGPGSAGHRSAQERFALHRIRDKGQGATRMSSYLTPRNLVVAALLIFLALVPVYASVGGNV